MIELIFCRLRLFVHGILYVFACILPFGGSAQTFNGQGGLLIPPGAPGQTVGITISPVTVSGIGILGQGCTQIDNVTMDVLHTWTGDIALFLISPNGIVLELSSGNGGASDNFSITVFTDFTPLFITQGMAPFNGPFRPEGRQQNTAPPFPNGNPLGTFTFQNTFDGVDADGEWQLYINDYVPADVGIINSWSITFSSGGGPAPEVTLGPDITVCPGQVSTLTAVVDPSADEYLWSTGETTSSIDVSPSVSTTYSVTVTNNGCIGTDIIEVIIDPNSIVADAGPDVDICQAESSTLTGSGGGSGATYTWSTGQTGSIITVNPIITTTYTLTVSEGVCSATDQVVVNVSPIPVADAGPDVEICDGESIDLEASGGIQNNDYSWSTGQSGSTITVNPSETTDYTVTVEVNGCIGTDDVLVTVFDAPEVDAGPDEEICLGENVTLTAFGSGGSYEWSNGQNGDEITVSPISTTTYSVTLTSNGCEATDEVEVDVISVIASAGPNQIICDGASVTLTASGGSFYEWSTGQTQQSISVSPSTTTTYFVTVSEGNCFEVASVEVEVGQSPSASVSPDQTICAGESVTLTASGGSDYNWSNGQLTPDILVTPTSTTTYTVTVTEQGCFDTAETTVSVDPVPATSAGPDQQICEGESAQLLATGLSGPGTYEWSTGETIDLITVSPLITTLYTVIATNEFDCAASDQVVVNVGPVPVADAGPNQFIVSGGNAVLTASGGNSYLWSTGATTPQITVSPTVTTSYTVTVTIGLCSTVDEVTVFVDEVPTVDLGPDFEICVGDTIALDASISGPFTLTYLWSTSQTDSLIQVAPDADTSYSVTVTNVQSGLSSVDTIYVTVNQPPIGAPVISGSGAVCAGGNSTYFALAVSDVTLYQWSALPDGTILSGQGTQQIEVMWPSAGAGQVQLIVSNDCGSLPAILFDQIIAGPPVIAGPLAGEVNPCAAGIYTYDIPAVSNATTYQWTLSGGGLIQLGQGTNAVMINWNNTAGGDLCVVASNSCGTSTSVCQTIQTVATPVLNAGPDLAVCGQTIILEGSGVGNWTQVSGPGASVFSVPGDPTSAVTVDQPGAYVFNYSFDQNGCFAEDESVVSFFNIPEIVGIEELCTGALADYTVSFEIQGGQSPYSVDGQSISGSDFQSGLIPSGAPYSFQVMDANGCISQTIIGLQECNCISDAGTMPSIQTGACVGEKATISYLGGGVYDLDDTLAFILHDGNLPGGIIYWNSIPDFEFVSGMVLDQVYYVSAVVGSKGTNGFPDITDPCLSYSNATPIVFYSLPVAMTVPSALLKCDPQSVQLDIGQSDAGNSFTYFWTSYNGGTIIGPVDGISITAGAQGNYVLTVENMVTGCTSSDTIIVIPANLSLEDLEFTVLPPLCPGECNGVISISSFNDDWSFDFGNGIYTIDPEFVSACSGPTSLIVKDSLGCSADTLIQIPVPSSVEVDLGPDQTIRLGDEIEVTASSGSVIDMYNWFDADTCTGCQSIVVKPLSTTIVNVEVQDQNGCQASDQVIITVLGSKDLFIPNIFSPNGDQINDILYIDENSRIKSVQLFEIFDRWGNLILHRENVTAGNQAQGWDGTFNGKPLNAGVYTLRIIVQFYDDDIVHKTGDVTLIR